MQIISVVRDFEMYDKCVGANPYNAGAELHPIDNRVENKGIPTRYNEFLDAYDYSKPDWFVFCHEDWEVKEAWQERLGELNSEKLYGPIGTSLNENYNPACKGQIINTNRDGGEKCLVGEKVNTGFPVGTFDCQCLLVHSDIIAKHRLRFDENLSYDLYVEDFCISAQEEHLIPSCIFSLQCQHWSHGSVQKRFFVGLKYLQKKYRKASPFTPFRSRGQ